MSPPLSKAGGESIEKEMIWLNLPIHQHWKYIKKLDQRRIALKKTIEYQRQYFFKDEHVMTIFHLLNKSNKLKFL